jgi:hypothetical protein
LYIFPNEPTKNIYLSNIILSTGNGTCKDPSEIIKMAESLEYSHGTIPPPPDDMNDSEGVGEGSILAYPNVSLLNNTALPLSAFGAYRVLRKSNVDGWIEVQPVARPMKRALEEGEVVVSSSSASKKNKS